MADRFFLLVNPNDPQDRFVEVYDPGHTDPVDAVPGFEGWTVVAETTRLPGEFETVKADGSIEENVVSREDTRAGKEHIARARMMKTIEAAMVLSGVTLTEGLLYREATALGIPITDLATQVRDAALPFYNREIQRRRNKLGL